MQGVGLTSKKRAHLLHIYLTQGFAVAKHLAVQYGITPQHMANLARESGCTYRQHKQNQANEAVNGALKEFMISREALSKSRYPYHVKIRATIIKRLNAAGFNNATIGRVIGIDPSSVRCWIENEYRERKTAKNVLRHKKAKETKMWQRAMQVGNIIA
jgi:hypothetical protein